MIIHGMPFNVELLEVLIELKAQLSANGVHRFEKIVDSGDDFMTNCPYHKDGQERKPSFGIRKSDTKCHCFTCGITVDLDEVIANCFGYNDPTWGFRWLLQNFATVRVEERKEIQLDMSRRHTVVAEQPESVSESELDSYRYTHPYLYERGLTDEIIAKFDIGYDKARNEITFPVYNLEGECIFVARRSVKTKRFDLPKDMEKPLYAKTEVELAYTQNMFHPVSEVYVCEGIFDCLRLWCNGKYAVAGFGCLFSEYQLKLLKELPTRKLILALDNDKAGKDGADKIRKAIKNKLITQVVIPDGYKDIGELSDEQIQNLEEVFV